jgi:hypothetical protein
MSEHESICSYGGHPYPTSGVCPNCMIIMQARIEGTGQPPPTGPLGAFWWFYKGGFGSGSWLDR